MQATAFLDNVPFNVEQCWTMFLSMLNFQDMRINLLGMHEVGVSVKVLDGLLHECAASGF